MCGIVGMFGDLDMKSDKALKMLLIMDSMRGEDSTGVAVVHKHMIDQVKVVKTLGDPFQLFGTKKYEDAIGGSNRAIIGHNRYATSGGVSRVTAHPFEFDTLVGVHNGTLNNKHVLADSNQFKVDSENLYHHIEKHGLHDAIGIAGGAWALAWWDKVEHTMNFLRNKERPLFYCLTEDKKQIFYASEAWMIQAALNRADIKYSPVEMFEVDTHYSVPVAKAGVIGKPLLTECKSNVKESVFFTGGNRGNNVTTIHPVVAQKNASVEAERSAVETKTGKASSSHVVTVNPIINKGSKWDVVYCNEKRRVYEAVCNQYDKHGASYVVCFDAAAPNYEVRLYKNGKHSIDKQLGCEFTANVGGFLMVDNGVGYYKLQPDSVVVVTAAVPDVPDLSVIDSHETTYLTNDGQYIDAVSWVRKHGECCWCGDTVLPSDLSRGAKITDGGEGVCVSCAKDRSLSQYVNFVE